MSNKLHCCRHVAGLTESRAENIFKYRMENGSFTSREELKKVKLIGNKTFEQCAGFLRIEQSTDLLDSTWIHPESYSLAERIMNKCNVKKENIGTEPFIAKIKQFMQKNSSEQLAIELKKPKERVREFGNCFSNKKSEIFFYFRLKVLLKHWNENVYVITEKIYVRNRCSSKA